jgi:hypothetical protein
VAVTVDKNTAQVLPVSFSAVILTLLADAPLSVPEGGNFCR